jgi:hypothetical protein
LVSHYIIVRSGRKSPVCRPQELLGHEDFRSLDVYAKLTILDLKAAHRKHPPREQGAAQSIDKRGSNVEDGPEEA